MPFGNYRVSDKPYDKLGFSIHNYFFAKALDQVRPGGIVGSEIFIGCLTGLQELLQLFVEAFIFFLCNTEVLGLFLPSLLSTA